VLGKRINTINVKQISTTIPDNFSLEQNYPNPFNPSTIIRFQTRGSKLTTFKVFDILGKEIAVLVNEILQPGTYEVIFDGSKLTSGVYFYRLQSEGYTETKRMIMLK